MSVVPAWLVLADGTRFCGEEFGAPASGEGEVVFHTGMTGYQEILTDPSYAGQIVCMTYPEIGNVGVNPEDEESRGVFLRGFVVRSHNDFPSSWRCEEKLGAYLKRHGIPAITGIDTRALVRRLRDHGAMNGVLLHGDVDPDEVVARAKALPSMAGQDLVSTVTTDEPYAWTESTAWTGTPERPFARRLQIVAYDFGVKRNILRELVKTGFDVTVVPASTPAAEVMARNPDGVFLSNGPGDPDAVGYAIESVRELIGRVPIFGICLGHQILALALGATTRKLRFGHHGANQPAHDHATGRVMIASENHGFAVDAESLAGNPDVRVTHTNLNDQCLEGLRHTRLPIFSVQYHPEASPGPHDTEHLFEQFRSEIEGAGA